MTKNYQKIVLTFILMFIISVSYSQGIKEKLANTYFDQLAYNKAVEIYEELANKEKSTYYQKQRTALCYYNIDNTVKAEEWFMKTVTHNEATDDDWYNYAQVLKRNKKYNDAKTAFRNVLLKNPNNSVAKTNANADDSYVSNLMDPSKYFDIFNAEFNSKHADFGPMFFKDGDTKKILFSTARRTNPLTNNKFQWDETSFLDIFEVNDADHKDVNQFKKDINSRYHEGPISFSNNNSRVYLTRSNYFNGKKGYDKEKHNNLKLFLGQVNENNWGELQSFEYNSDDYSVGHATVSEDGNTMIFVSDMQGTKGLTDLWISNLANGKWSKPSNISDLNTEGKEMFPFLHKNGDLYFASDGHLGLGGLDIFVARKSGNSWGKPENIGYPINTNHDDFALIFEDQMNNGYFSSNRTEMNAKGNDDIYFFKSQDLIDKTQGIVVEGCAVDVENKTNIPLTTIELYDVINDKVIKKIKTNASGCYKFTNVPEGEYIVRGENINYIKIKNFDFKTKDYSGYINNANVEFKKGNCEIYTIIKDAQSGKLITNAKVKVTNNKTGEVKNYISDDEGKVTLDNSNIECPGEFLDYTLNVSSDNYAPQNKKLTKILTNPGPTYIEVELFPSNIKTLNDVCGVTMIYYDLDKSNIRPDAASELDKIVKCMKDNPSLVVEVASHTDCRNTHSYNNDLSNRRATSAKKYIISKGIKESRISGKGYGETQLVNDCNCDLTDTKCSDEQHQLNRRTEFRVIKQ